MNRESTDFSTKISCPIFPACGGCQFHESVTNPPVLEEITSYFAPLPFQFFTDKTTHWRTKARLAVRGKAGNPHIGLFEETSHRVVDMPFCPLHLENLNKALRIAKNKIRDLGVSPYEEKRFTGDLRYLQLWSDESGKVQLTLVATHDAKIFHELARELWQTEIFHSIWLNLQPDTTNRILGPSFDRLKGSPFLIQKFLDRSFHFHPATFVQAHCALFETILKRMRHHLLPSRRVVEYYAGVGVIGLSLSDSTTSLTCIEINPYAERCFEKNAQAGEATYITAEAKEASSHVDNADVVIVDPPRKGLDTPLLEKLCAAPLDQVLYLSCNFDSLKRDLEHLTAHGYTVDKAEGFLLFPGSDHVEVLVNLLKS